MGMGLGDHLQGPVIDRPRGGRGGRGLNCSLEEPRSHPQRQGSRKPCGVGCLPVGE